MGAPQVLPDPDELRKMLERGKTQREIADEFGVTKQAVSFHVRRRNLRPAPKRYKAAIPWRVIMKYQNDHKLHMLQAYARRAEGLPLNEVSAKQLDAFLRNLDKLNAVIDYNDEDGLYLVERRPVDEGYTRNPEK